MIAIDEVDPDGETFLATIHIRGLILQVAGRILTWTAKDLHIAEVHVQGGTPGSLGRAGLNELGRMILRECNVQNAVIEGAVRTTGRRRGSKPDPIRFP